MSSFVHNFNQTFAEIAQASQQISKLAENVKNINDDLLVKIKEV